MNHFPAACQQFVQRPFVHHPPILQDHDLVGAPQGSRAMGDHQARQVRAVQEPPPQQLLGLYVQRAGQVVKDEQLCLPHEHARCSGPLHLAAGQAQPARFHLRVETARYVSHIGIKHGQVHSARQVDPVFRQTQQDVVAQRLAEQARRLGRVSHPWRHEKLPQVGYPLAIPTDLAGLQRQQAQQHPQWAAGFGTIQST